MKKMRYSLTGQRILYWTCAIECWITEATNTHPEYVIRIAFPRQQLFQERASMLRLYVHCHFFILITDNIFVILTKKSKQLSLS
jgi:hypothetical protein